jgi:hypothetical protein
LGDSSYTPPFENPFGGGGTTGSSDQTTIVTTPQNQNGSTQNTNQLILAPVFDDEGLPLIEKTPCEHLNYIIADDKIQAKFKELRTGSSGLVEKGFFFNQTVKNYPTGASLSYINLAPIPQSTVITSSLYLDGPTGLPTGKVISLNHNHTNPDVKGSVQMLSPGDILDLLIIARKHNTNGLTKDYSLYAIYVTTLAGNYAIKFNGSQDIAALTLNFEKFYEAYDLSLRSLKSESLLKNENHLILLFLDAAKKTNFNGINIFKANEDTVANNSKILGWNKLTLNENNSSNPINETPCN